MQIDNNDKKGFVINKERVAIFASLCSVAVVVGTLYSGYFDEGVETGKKQV